MVGAPGFLNQSPAIPCAPYEGPSENRSKQIVLASHGDYDYQLNIGEVALLREEAFDIDSRGKVVVRSANLRTLNNIRFTLSIVGRTIAPGYEPPVGDAGWEALQKALKVRHRVTHPKERSDLAISNDELDQIRAAFKWFRSALVTFFKRASDYSHERFERIVGEHTEEGRGSSVDEAE